MASLLPPIRSTAELDRVRSEERLWRPVMTEIARRHRLPEAVRLFPTGSAVVFGVGDDHVVKLHEPWHRQLFETEAACLRIVEGRLPVPSPELMATGEIEGWAYLVMTRLPGQPLSEVRDQLDRADRIAIAAQAGALARRFQAVPVPPSFRPFLPWTDFLSRQSATCVERHRAYGLPERLLACLEEQLAGVSLAVEEPVLLHTELTDTNLMATRREGGWQLSGVFDFEPSMLGHPLYDLPAVTIFVARGDPEPCRAALEAFGLRQLDSRLRRQLLACTLLHRYSRLDFFLSLVGVDGYLGDWGEIAAALLGF